MFRAEPQRPQTPQEERKKEMNETFSPFSFAVSLLIRTFAAKKYFSESYRHITGEDYDR